MSDAEDNTKTVDREAKDSKDKVKEDGDHLDNQVGVKTEDGKDDGGKSKEKMTPNKKNAKSKSQKKEEEDDDDEEEDDEDDDEDEEDSDEENDKNGKVPLLDQPLQISGTRDRKKVQRFTEEFKVLPKESPKNEIPEGRGTQLGEIPRIEAIIQKLNAEKLKPLHKVLFKGPCKPATVKRNIRKFNGFDFNEGSDQYSKKRSSILKMDVATLKSLSRNLDLTTGGSREEIVNRLLEFLMEPKDSEKPLKDSKKKKASTKNAKRQKSNPSKGKKKKRDSDDEISSEAEEETEENDVKESSEDEKESEDEKVESEDDDNKKKKPLKKKATANAKKPAPKKVEEKKETKKAESEKKKRKETEMKSDDDESSSEDEPLVKKAKQPPTDDEIKSYVKQILEGANLEEITMKTVCKQVYAAYPDFDLAHKKDFIKTTVKSLIST